MTANQWDLPNRPAAASAIRFILQIRCHIPAARNHHGCVSVLGRKHASRERVCRLTYLTNTDQSKDAALRDDRSASFDYGLSPFAHAKRAPLLFAPNVKCTQSPSES